MGKGDKALRKSYILKYQRPRCSPKLRFIRKEQRQFEQAKELLVRAKSVNDKNPQVYRVLADIYRGMNQNDLAIEQYEAYLKMNPTASDKGEVEGTIKSLR